MYSGEQSQQDGDWAEALMKFAAVLFVLVLPAMWLYSADLLVGVVGAVVFALPPLALGSALLAYRRVRGS